MAAKDHFLDRHMCHLIQNVTMVIPALDGLLENELLTDEQYGRVASNKTNQEQMRELYRQVKGWGDSEKDTVYRYLKKANPGLLGNAKRPQPVMAPGDPRDELNASTCLDINTDPETLTGGHNFCTTDMLVEQEGSGAYAYPKYRTEFMARPALKKAEETTKGADGFLPTQQEKGETGNACTNCDHSYVPAVKSHLRCEVSPCDDDLRIHSKSQEHVLTEPTTSLRTRRCAVHKNIQEEAASTCVSGRLEGDHNRCQVEALSKASEKKQKLRKMLEKMTSEKEETEERVQSLLRHERDVKEKTADIAKRAIVLFKDIKRQLKVLRKRVLNEVYRQEEQVSLSVSDLIQQLEIKKDELTRKMCHIEELCNMTDPITLLEEEESDTDGFCDTVEGDNEDSERQVHDVGDLDEGLISATLHTGLSDIITGIKRGIYVQELNDILLDVNTAENHVHISDDLKTASWSQVNLKRPEVPQRFDYSQVFSIKGFSSGRIYWEVEISETGAWRVGMSYPSVGRKGKETSIGYNRKSWCLCRWLDNMEYAVLHNWKAIKSYHNISYRRFGIYLDYEDGRLSFYELCIPTRHLHTFTATFTEPLHAAIYVWDRECDKGCWVRIRSYEK